MIKSYCVGAMADVAFVKMCYVLCSLDGCGFGEPRLIGIACNPWCLGLSSWLLGLES